MPKLAMARQQPGQLMMMTMTMVTVAGGDYWDSWGLLAF
jgi:hypothetical protein